MSVIVMPIRVNLGQSFLSSCLDFKKVVQQHSNSTVLSGTVMVPCHFVTPSYVTEGYEIANLFLVFLIQFAMMIGILSG